MAAEMNLHLGYRPGEDKPEGQANERNGRPNKAGGAKVIERLAHENADRLPATTRCKCRWPHAETAASLFRSTQLLHRPCEPVHYCGPKSGMSIQNSQYVIYSLA